MANAGTVENKKLRGHHFQVEMVYVLCAAYAIAPTSYNKSLI